jgi:hypothetical protein
MKHKVAQTELDRKEYLALARTAKKNHLSINEALRQAALEWIRERSGINPNDHVFRLKPVDWGKGTENASEEVDETVYG